MNNKNIDCYIKLQIPSQEANPTPPIGPSLGQKGINIIKFCKEFNNYTINIEKGVILSVIITVYFDKSFTFIVKSTPTSILLKRESNIDIGSSSPGNKFVSTITMDKIIKIANLKINESFSNDINSVCKSIIGTAKSMGIKIN